jgi:hypothetical protein
MPGTAAAETYLVMPDGSGDVPTIQAALDAAVDGDIIELGNGTFTGDGNRDLVIGNRHLALRSQSLDRTLCIIDPQGADGETHRALLFVATPSDFLVSGIQIRGGTALSVDDNYGGAVRFDNAASPTISGCLFRNNRATRGGAAFLFETCQPTFEYCIFEDNEATDYAGAVMCAQPGANAEFLYCTFLRNRAGGSGGAISIWNSCAVEMTNCTFYRNRAPDGGGIALRWGPTLTLESTLIACSIEGEAIYSEGGTVSAACTDVYANGGGDWVGPLEGLVGSNGNINLNPLLCPYDSEFKNTCDTSPCASGSATNPPGCGQIGAWGAGCLSCLFACCVAGECQFITPQECEGLSGSLVTDPVYQVCDPNPCPVPAQIETWGAVKARFR